jgi:stringent starvation protein B
VIVDAQRPGVEVPAAYVKDGKIVLNLSMTATQRLQLKNDWIEFDARFAGVVHHVRVPLAAVLGVYARETGEGMIFSETETEGEPTPPESPAPREGPASTGPARKPKLTVVK